MSTVRVREVLHGEAAEANPNLRHIADTAMYIGHNLAAVCIPDKSGYGSEDKILLAGGRYAKPEDYGTRNA